MSRLTQKLSAVAFLAVLAVLGATGLYAAGVFPSFPTLGQTSPVVGPTAFTGNETVPSDTNVTQGAGPATILLNLPQLGQGVLVDNTTVTTAMTIPNGTPWFFLDGAQGSAITITMPAATVHGQIQRVICEAATVGTVAVSANTGQTVKNSPGAACAVGTTWNWVWNAANSTWYRF